MSLSIFLPSPFPRAGARRRAEAVDDDEQGRVEELHVEHVERLRFGLLLAFTPTPSFSSSFSATALVFVLAV